MLILCILSCGNEKPAHHRNNGSTKPEKSLSQKPTCSLIEKADPEVSDPIIIKKCVWKNYKFITTGSSDYKGRYSYEYEVYRITDGEDIKIKNEDIFNSSVNTLEKQINLELAKELNENRKYPDNAECLSEVEKPSFSINDMGISIDNKDRMVFDVSFGLSGACFNVDGASASFSLKEISKFIK